MTPATVQKRQQLLDFIRVKMEPYEAVQGVVAVGSIGTGTAHDDSDIDAVVFLDPYDPYIVPAEAIWRDADDTFHSIFTEDEDLQKHGLQLDFNRLDFRVWSQAGHAWPEPMKAEIGSGWIAFDRYGQVERLIRERTVYSDDVRLARLDECIVWLDQLLGEGEPERVWHTLGEFVAHDRLNAAYDYLVQVLFAYNRRWRTWKTREMTALLQLPWHPKDFHQYVGAAFGCASNDYRGYCERAEALRCLYRGTVSQLVADGTYGPEPVSEAFIRSHDESGRAWNMQAWMEQHRWRTSASP
ncbi:MAG: nucleotidyltransferase domain-containing protein [Alicyclobacillus sp.]|nr:nucleotidyltransferase domain-containing protein [Alicyclobacillus sp.]